MACASLEVKIFICVSAGLMCVCRCLDLPEGVYENIIEYMPQPRIWQWTLTRVKLRCKLSPLQAMLDISTVMDEILCDSCIIAGADQQQMLVKINKSPQVSHCFDVNKLHV